MHIPDGYLGPQTYGAAYAVMLPAWAIAARRLSKTLSGRRAPLLGLAAAFCFVVQMLNIPLPGGTTGHATGAALVAIVLGPAAAVVAVTVALAVQALVFGDGGITAFGANCFNMALVLPLVSAGVFRLFAGNPGGQPHRAAPTRNRLSDDEPTTSSHLQRCSRRRFFAAAAAGYVGICAAAFTTAMMFGLQPLLAHDAAGRALYSPYPLSVALPAMLLPHLLVFGFVEAAVTGLALAHLEGIPLPWKPAFTAEGQRRRENPSGRLLKVIGILALISPLGLLLPAWLGSGTAWGEWSAKEVARVVGFLPQGMASWAERWKAPVSDYAFRWQGESAGWLALTYLVSALVGAGLVIGLGWGLGRLLGRGKRTQVAGPDSLFARPCRAGFTNPAGPNSAGMVMPALQSATRSLGDQQRFLRFLREAMFAEDWARSPFFLQRLEARAKLLGLLAVLVTISLVHGLLPLAGMALMALGLALFCRVGLRGLRHPLWWAGPLFAVIIALPVVFFPGTAGLETAGRLVLRVTASVWWVGALLLSSRWDSLLAGLRALRIPAVFVLSLALAHRYLFALVRRSERAQYARRSRAILPGGPATECAVITGRIANLFRYSLRLAGQVHLAMVARGFGDQGSGARGQGLEKEEGTYAFTTPPASLQFPETRNLTPDTRPPVFALEQVRYSYPEGQLALEGVSLSVSPGESLVVLGANACGKSTLLHLLDGLAAPLSGDIRAFGESLSPARLERPAFAREFRKKVGLVFQDTEAQLFCPTVGDEIAFGPLQLGLPPEELLARVQQTLSLCGLAGLEDRPPYSLSGGEKKRVAIATVLSIGPEVLLLDEPTADLDPRAQTWLVELINQLRQAGKTLISATHDLSIVEEIADRVVVFGEDHRVRADGKPETVLADLDLLLEVNLIHEHTHAHGALRHRHPHAHGTTHSH